MRPAVWYALGALLTGCGSSTDAPLGSSASCAPSLPAIPYGYTEADAPLPGHFRHSTEGTVVLSDNGAPDDPITNAGATLGRVLFYDARLSTTDSVSCASCHRQSLGFGDTARFSPGVHGRHRARRSMALANARFNARGRFFWDERALSLEMQALEVIQDTMEMGMDLDALERKLAAEPFYPALFAAAFGSPEVTRDRVATALAEFVRSLVSAGSRYDAVFATGGAPDYSVLTEREREGSRVFGAAGCAGCHRSIVQFADQASNNGLDVVPTDSGAGQGRFKPASLRNIAVRPPYMHDGRFATLREVVAFYDHGVQAPPDVDPRLLTANGTPRRLNLTPDEVDALVAFLETLTDSDFLRAERFANPFPCVAGVGSDPASPRAGLRRDARRQRPV